MYIHRQPETRGTPNVKQTTATPYECTYVEIRLQYSLIVYIDLASLSQSRHAQKGKET